MVVPNWEQQAYNRQNQWLWDQLVSGHCSADLIRLILRPTKRGYYNDVPVIGEEGNGVLALWVLMMHFRKCNETYCLSLIDCLEKSESLFRSPKASIASSVKQVSTVLKECIDLGMEEYGTPSGRYPSEQRICHLFISLPSWWSRSTGFSSTFHANVGRYRILHARCGGSHV